MLKRLRSHLTYANVTATLALFVALGGSSYAALSITGRDVKNNSLTGRDVRSLTTKDVRDGSLQARDLAADTLPELTLVTRVSQTFGVSPCEGPCSGQPIEVANSVKCAPGEVATGGGVTAAPVDGDDVSVTFSRPNGAHESTPTGWEAGIRYTPRPDATAKFLSPTAWVICASL